LYEKCEFDSWSVPGNPGASSDVADKVLLQEIDANDYVTMLFNPRGLVARLIALTRRVSCAAPENLYFFETSCS
jgi:DNA-binding response OmpR family regulator